MPDIRPVFFFLGLMLLALGLCMFVPMGVDLALGDAAWPDFFVSGTITILFGAMLSILHYDPEPKMGTQSAFLLTFLSWVALSAFAALPFILSPDHLGFTDAVFESISGFTTTGSTVMSGLDNKPHSILLWRALLQWIGGVGIIVTGLAFLPVLQVGGMQLFRTESSDVGDKLMPKVKSMAAAIMMIYIGMTALCMFGFEATGMGLFDALSHALTTVSTGGYSTSDASMAAFMDGGADLVCDVFMLAGALPFGVFILMVRGKVSAPLEDPQVISFLAIVAAMILSMTLFLWVSSEFLHLQALRLAAFNVISIVTSTGYVSADYNNWGSYAVAAFFLFMFVGGCAGSTSGGLKVFRFGIIYAAIRAFVMRMPRKHMVTSIHYAGKPLSPTIVYSVLSYAFLFFVTFAILATTLSFLGLDPETAWSGAATALTNTGPGMGQIIGPTGNFAALPDQAKWVLMGGMILGRLEIIPLLVVLNPDFWKT